MNITVLTKSYPAPPVNEKEILRYARCGSLDEEAERLLKSCISEASEALSCKVCYAELPAVINGSHCDFGVFELSSENLSKNLSGCDRVIIFAATAGVGIDRLIAKYARISPAKSVLLQAIGAERVEAVCDAFCSDVEKEYKTKPKPRFSPGYGDVSLQVQKNFFAVLECEKRVGITLNENLFMSPSKSVTAFVGIPKEAVL